MKQKIYQVDAFTDQIFAGNPAAVCPFDSWLNDELMQKIAQEKLKGHAAICSKYAAELYQLKILEEGIETNKRNFTRFLLIANRWLAEDLQKDSEVTKSSLVFTLPHSEGSLSKVLTILSFYDLNLTKIQSLPIIGREWEYLFYIDLTFNNLLKYKQGLEAVRPLTKDFKILGEYKENNVTNI